MLYWKLLKAKDGSEEKATNVHILVMHMREYIHERSWKRNQVSHISKWQGVKVSVKSQWCTDELRRLFEMFDFDQLEWLGSDHLSIGLDLLSHPCNGIAPCTLGYVWCSFGGIQVEECTINHWGDGVSLLHFLLPRLGIDMEDSRGLC